MIPPSTLPRLPALLLRALLPLAERDEVLAELAEEHTDRARRSGATAARLWVWRQVVSSFPSLLRRAFWRGMTGFEPKANRMQPGGPPMESWIIDLRYALRRLRTRPLYAALAVLTLALGVGGAAAISGVVRTLLVKPLPYSAERDLVVFWNTFDWSEQEFLYLRPDFPGFQRVAAYRPEDVTLQSGREPARLLLGISATAELFEVLGRQALIGRAFRAGDDLQGSEQVAVLSYGLWRELGGDPPIVGRPLRLDGVERTVVGVMPRDFWFPDPAVRVWLAQRLDPENRSGNYALVGRMEPGMTSAAIGSRLARITARLHERYDYPVQFDKTKNAKVTALREYLLGGVRPALLATLAAMGLILLIACANVAALMLGQVDGRAMELAVRSALGAERIRVMQQLVAESLVVGLLAALIGAAVAASGFRVLVDALPLGVWSEGAVLDWTVFWAALAAAVPACLLVSVAPGVSLWHGDVRGVLARRRTAGVGGRGGRLESGLVIGEVALAVLMTAGAALLMRSVGNLYGIRPGVDVKGVALLDLALPADMELEQRRVALRRLIDELATLPGVRAAAITHKLPLRGSGSSSAITVEGGPDPGITTTYFRIVSPGYLEAVGIPLRSGRTFIASDRGQGPPPEGGEIPVVVNEALAAKYFPGEDPVGHFVGGGFGARERIIGVVGNAAEAELSDAPAPARYWLLDHTPFISDAETLVLRVAPGLDAVSVLEPARSRVEQLVPSVAVQEATTMELVLAKAVGPARQVMVLLGLLTGLALLLGAVGVYGVITHYVSRRRSDWAIRMALGLSPSLVVARVVRRAAALVVAGIAIGVVMAVVLARFIRSFLYGVGAADPLAMAVAALTLLMVGLLAALVPAWRAGRTPPALLLREV